MFKKIAAGIVLFAATGFLTVSIAAEDPSLHDVYQAADAGRFSDAQAMMDKVLRDHPKSAKAHYVESELLAKQGRLPAAQSELNVAEGLSPGLPFAKPDSVQHLKTLIMRTRQSENVYSGAPQIQHASSGGFPWGLLLVGLGILAAIALFMRSLNRNNLASAGGSMYGQGTPMQSYNGGMGQPMGQTGGIGSGIMGGLATGAAVGAGIVAGEALMHHFVDGDNRSSFNSAPPYPDNGSNLAADDMGGSDFGIADNSSWDDSSSGGGGGGDWDS